MLLRLKTINLRAEASRGSYQFTLICAICFSMGERGRSVTHQTCHYWGSVSFPHVRAALWVIILSLPGPLQHFTHSGLWQLWMGSWGDHFSHSLVCFIHSIYRRCRIQEALGGALRHKKTTISCATNNCQHCICVCARNKAPLIQNLCVLGNRLWDDDLNFM